MTPNISYRPTRLPDAVPPNRNSCAGQPPETASGNYPQPSRFQHATPPPCLRRPYNKYRISLPTFQKIPEFYRFIKSIFYGTRLLPLPRQRTVRTATALKGGLFQMRPEGTPRLPRNRTCRRYIVGRYPAIATRTEPSVPLFQMHTLHPPAQPRQAEVDEIHQVGEHEHAEGREQRIPGHDAHSVRLYVYETVRIRA